MSQDQTQVDMNSILDGTIDDLMDAPTFEPFKAGSHRIVISDIEQLVVNKHPSFKVKLKLLETLELGNSSDTAQAAGSEAEVLYMMDNEMGQGNFKNILKSLAAHFGTATNRETIAAAKGAECVVITNVRTNKEKTASYTEIKNIEVV
jgi:hypothetical protein